jgi:hypothetical protein
MSIAMSTNAVFADNAVFAQVDDEVLSRIQSSPALGQSLFLDRTAPPPDLPAMFQTMLEQARGARPEMLADAGLPPELRQQMEGSLAQMTVALAPGGGLDVILKGLQPFAEKGRELPVPRAVLKLDEAWHGVHYVLCGEAEAGTTLLSQAVLGGVELGGREPDCDPDEIWGEGPARYFTVARVAELAAALGGAAVESEAAARFDAARLKQLGIHPGWQDSDKEWVMDAFRRLRDFYADASANGLAMVTCLV